MFSRTNFNFTLSIATAKAIRTRGLGQGGERKKGWGAEERRSGGVGELRKKRELIIFGYLARKSHPKFRSPRTRGLGQGA
ncbi:MAG: hypothetical protein F6K41_02020 [Symploca sp. SIO3E6]|nr:hypothetical protein [Caldora sp. SIO3E6]